MAHFSFIKYLSASIVISILLFYGLNLIIDMISHQTLLWWSLGFFIILSLITFFVLDLSLKKANGSGFIGLVMINVFFKLVASFVLVAAYVNQYQPQEKTFIIPFLSTYLVFTILETYFLNVQARGVR